MTSAIVEVKGLTKIIKNKTIIDNISFDLQPGTITGFLGPNGAGKTTTIRMLVGLMTPTAGEVLINGCNLKTHYEQAISEVGVIVENPEMYKFLTGYKNLQHFARMNKHITKSRIDEVVAQMGLENRIHEKVSTYSLGMRQRLGLAQALLHKPSFLILDEPTNGLDPAGIHEFRTYLRRIAEEQGVAILVSSHLLSEMELMCDRIIIIQTGKITNTRELTETTEIHYALEAIDADDVLIANNIPFIKHDTYYSLTITRDDVPLLLHSLINANVTVYSLAIKQQSLEAEFLALTGGGAIA